MSANDPWRSTSADRAVGHVRRLTDAGMTPSEIAAAAGLHRSTISQLRSGTCGDTVRLDILTALAKVPTPHVDRGPGDGWRERAACAGRTDEMFPSEGRGTTEQTYSAAKAICAGCEVVDECWSWVSTCVPVVDIQSSGGVWAGRSPHEAVHEIRAMRRKSA
jgi:transcriptional regulator with XRE-family HTH domain